MSKRYCFECDKKLKDDICLNCEADNSFERLSSLDHYELRRTCYKRLKICKDKINQGLSNLLIACILFAIAAIFFGLSFKLDSLAVRGFNPATMEFVVSMVALAFCIFFLTLSLIKLIPYKSREKYYSSLLASIKKDETKE